MLIESSKSSREMFEPSIKGCIFNDNSKIILRSQKN